MIRRSEPCGIWGKTVQEEGTTKRKKLESLRWCPSCGRKATWLEPGEQGGSDGEGVGDTERGRITDHHGELVLFYM